MPGSVLDPPERRFLEALNDLGIRYLLVGVSAAVMQGARVGTEDIDLWFDRIDDPKLHEAAKRAGGVWISGHFGMQPPAVGGEGLAERFDVVMTMSGLSDFATEYAKALELELDGVPVRVLPLERIIHSKKCAGRIKDRAVLPALEAALAVKRDKSAGD